MLSIIKMGPRVREGDGVPALAGVNAATERGITYRRFPEGDGVPALAGVNAVIERCESRDEKKPAGANTGGFFSYN